MKKFLLFTLVALLGFASVRAQVTTSSLTGTVRDAKGEPLIGATVKAIHTPTGTVYGASTNTEGRVNMGNMRVGGPYTIAVSYIGFDSEKIQNVYLKLGEPYVLHSILGTTGRELQEVVVTGSQDQILNSRRTGAATNISKKQLETLPTVNRSLQDFTRMTPQMTSSNSFSGTSGKYNNITIDGAVNNDVFGLSSAGSGPGSGAGTQPISLDAIQEVQVVLAPYDITYGNFTGGGINAITRSGTNEFQGSAYTFLKSQDFVGKNVLTDEKYPSFSDNQYGLRLGGPLIKDKLFFFVNGELGRRSAPLANNAGENGSAISVATAKQIRDFTLEKYGYDVGSYDALDLKRNNDKVFARIDWNINNKHQLMLRHNYISAFDDNLSRSGTIFNFGNTAYQFTNKQNITVAELRSNFSSQFSNNLILGYSRIRDKREPGDLFPFVQINNIEGVSSNRVNLGTERSSYANQLDQDIFEITNNFKYNTGKHTFTFGTHNEFFKFRNLYINNFNGYWEFDNLATYLAGTPKRLQATYSNVDGVQFPASKFNAAQYSVYAQDEFEAFEGFRLTAGVRLDIPVLNDKPAANAQIAKTFADQGYRTDKALGAQFLWAPRVGFNYDVLGDRSIQLRGGVGVFTGRAPFVWMSNAYGNDGVMLGTVDVATSTRAPITTAPPFSTDINNYRNLGPAGGTAEVNLIADDFKLPQLLRYNLAGDFKLPFGVVGTLEGIFSKTLNNIVYRDVNMKPSVGTINGGLSNNQDNRPVYTNANASGKIDPKFTNVLLIDNTSRGYTYSVTAQLQKNFNFGLNAMVAYTNGKSKGINDGTSSTAKSNWQFMQIVNDPNSPDLAYTQFDIRHRVVGSLSYAFQYGAKNEYATGISLFYSGRSGLPYSIVYNGDLNGDGGNGNDLIFVPASIDQIKLAPITGNNPLTVAQQWENLDAFISNNDYLRKNRGKYTARNGARMPWEHQFDLRVYQDLGTVIAGKKHALQITFDVFNVGNLINKDWGRAYTVANQSLTLISYNSSASNFTFNRSNPDGYDVLDFASRWQGQLGLRYSF
ncbi:MAG: TonB-dependent receptor [Arcticibacter sp.]